MALIECSTCGTAKSEEDFQVRSDTGRRRSDCRACRSADNLRRYHTRPETKQAHRSASRRHAVKKHYGLAPEEYERLVSISDGACWTCGAPPTEGRFHCVDHDHATGEVRGLLCLNCNTALGQARDSITLLRSLIGYLEGSNVHRRRLRD